MNTVTAHKVYRKVVHNKRNLDPRLVSYLEDTLVGSLTKVKLLVDSPGFYRWELCGLEDRQLVDAPLKERSTFYYLKPVLVQLWPDSLTRICKKVGKKDLILDFTLGSHLFRKFTEDELAEADRHRFIWEANRKGDLWNRSELNIIPGPITIF